MSRQPIGIHGATHDPTKGSDPIPGVGPSPYMVWGALFNDGSVIEGTGFTAEWSGGSAWSSLTSYVAGDIVNSGGNSYVCILANTNQVPPNATYWTLVSSTTGNAFSIIFTTAFTNPPVVLLTANNNNPETTDGAYGVSLKLRATAYIVAITTVFAGTTPTGGGFDFLCIEPGV